MIAKISFNLALKLKRQKELDGTRFIVIRYFQGFFLIKSALKRN